MLRGELGDLANCGDREAGCRVVREHRDTAASPIPVVPNPDE
jgi:hypothetical protein